MEKMSLGKSLEKAWGSNDILHIMKVSKKGREIHGQAEHAREKEQDFLKSMQLLDKAMLVYEKEGDLRGLTEALQSRSSAYKHLFQHTSDKTFLTLAKYEALAGVEIAESLDDPSALVMAYRGLAKVLEQLEDWKGTARYFTEALRAFEKNPPPENNRPAVASDLKAHLAFAVYKSGDKKEGVKIMDTAVSELEKDTEEEKYNKDVWLSGAHMRAATMLQSDNPKLAKRHLQKASEIIKSNSELKLRAKQLDRLEKSLKNK